MKRIDFSKPIPANGKTYKVASELSINRFRILEELEIEFYYGFTMQDMFTKLKETFELMDKGKIAQSSVKVHNLLSGVADRLDKREPVMLRICSLFLITDGEDVNEWSEELAKGKIDDWSKEGYAINDFFSLAANLVPGFMKDYEEILEGTLEGAASLKKSQDKKPSSPKKKSG